MNTEQIKALEITRKIVEQTMMSSDHFLSGDKDTRFYAFENIIGKSVYDFTQDEVNQLVIDHKCEIDLEYDRLIEVGKINSEFYQKMIDFINSLINNT